MNRLVIASGNAGKVREFGHLLAGLGLEIQPQPEGLEVEETGTTFAENARLKASAVARACREWALADDSGLSVDALNGAPGVHSARYADSDSARIARLLRELDDANRGATIPNRQAHFAAALALADPSGTIRLEVEGRCPGVILDAPRGTGGFGYDPVFLVPEAGLTRTL
jgi:XTP/dITP diphosphohydrolase